MTIIDQINKHLYPNALAKLRVSLKDMSIKHIGETAEGARMARKNNKNNNNDTRKNGKTCKNQCSSNIELIWKNLSLGKIDITYACVGYTLDGRPVICQDDFVSLLSAYGFDMQSILLFIDDYAIAEREVNNSKAPVIMYRTNTAKIMTEITPIVN